MNAVVQFKNSSIHVTRRDGSRQPLMVDKINLRVQEATKHLEPEVSWSQIVVTAELSWYDGVTTREIDETLVRAAHTLTTTHPKYSYAAASLMLCMLKQDIFGARDTRNFGVQKPYRAYFRDYLRKAIDCGVLSPKLGIEAGVFRHDELIDALDPERDRLFDYQGLKTIQDRYLVRDRKKQVLEMPQWMWMRVAMGLALNEKDPTNAAVTFYHTLSQHDYMPSTPTLFNSGTAHSQLSSCYLSSVPDSLKGIMEHYTSGAYMAKGAGGLGEDWTMVRGTGSLIKGTNGDSSGVVPWLFVANALTLAVNQGGKRKGSRCAYLETWHIDIEGFLELRKNSGDYRLRTHDMNTANWIPDLFFTRVLNDEPWSLFSPIDVPELHDLHGLQFKQAYEAAEERARRGEIPSRVIQASDLFRMMCTMLFETGHPWMVFKDACNVRSPQQHCGVVHSSNLCTEIMLNTRNVESDPENNEQAVCNIGSVNLANHLLPDSSGVDKAKLGRTIKVAVRMLDNVIDLNAYPTAETERSAKRHRPIGLGVMGFQDVLYRLRIPFASDAQVSLSDSLMEYFSYCAIEASCDLAIQRGKYSSFDGSLWSQGIFPIDTLDLLEKQRGSEIPVSRVTRLDWDSLKAKVKQHGMRNSNVMAIAPTATISRICGVSQSIEPTFKNLNVESQMSGEFVDLNQHLVNDLCAQGLWCDQLAEALNRVEGDLTRISPALPTDIVKLYQTAFQIEPNWIIDGGAARGKWVDQGQSLNLYYAGRSAKVVRGMYLRAWQKALKSTYYLRVLGASTVEKSTVDSAGGGEQLRRETTHSGQDETAPKACLISNPDCDACQ